MAKLIFLRRSFVLGLIVVALIGKRQIMHPFIAVYLFGFLAASSPPEGTKTLVAPIYAMTRDYSTVLVVLDAAGRASPFTPTGFTAEGIPVLGDSTRQSVGFNSVKGIIFEPDFSGNFIGNGWVRLTYPADRELRATSHITTYRDGDRTFTAFCSAVEPASDFRFHGRRVDGEETAVSIVNPTGSDQSVTVRFHPGWLTPVTNQRPGSIEKTWEIAAMHRMSRFLSELVPLDEYDVPSDGIGGLVHIQGETQIAVGALNFSRKTRFFCGIPVRKEN